MAGPIALAWGILLAVGSIMGIAPARDILNQWLYSLYPVALPQIFELLEMHHREIINDEQLDAALKRTGMDTTWIPRLQDVTRQMVNANDLIIAHRRELIDRNTFLDKMRRIKLDGEDIALLEQVSLFFPSPPDLVRFAVREVFTPEIRNKFGMDEDRPEIFMKEASKAGLPEQTAKDFWAAHWELPSTLQGFRMFHRGIIDVDELKLLMKSLDIMPFWRDKLISLSHNVLTRVDVRRMYGLGVLDADAVKKAYKDIGYSEDNAIKMTEFTIEFENDENKGITRSSVVSAYKKGAISEEELTTYLKALRFSEKVVNFWVSTSVHDKIMGQIDDEIDTNVETYVAGGLTLSELTQLLNAMGLPDTYTQDILRRAELKRRKKVKLPSKEDLIKWYSGNIIDSTEFTGRMLETGYRPNDIDIYIEANQPELVE